MINKVGVNIERMPRDVKKVTSADPFYVDEKSWGTAIMDHGELRLAQVVDAETEERRDTDVNMPQYKRVRLRIFLSDTDYKDVTLKEYESHMLRLNKGKYTRVLVHDGNILFEYNAYTEAYVTYDLNTDEETLSHTAPLPDTCMQHAKGTETVDANSEFTYISRLVQNKSKSVTGLVFAILFLLIITVLAIFYGSISGAVVLVLMIAVVIAGIVIIKARHKKAYKIEQDVLEHGEVYLARVSEVGSHEYEKGTIDLLVYTPDAVVPVTYTASARKMKALRGDYVRVKYISETAYVIEGDPDRGEFLWYNIDYATERLRYK